MIADIFRLVALKDILATLLVSRIMAPVLVGYENLRWDRKGNQVKI
ncbi:MAG: hypothetical protein ACTSWN_13585 [Promethearchaeota archaeon]